MASAADPGVPPGLAALLATRSVAGAEEACARVLAGLFREAGADRVEVDLSGNLFAVKGDPRRAVVCHMDTVGFMVKTAEAPRCPLMRVGYPDPAAMQRGVLETRDGGAIPGLILAGKDGKDPVFEPVDPGAVDAIRPGDRVSYAPGVEVVGGRVHSPYLDNRIGCYAAVEVIRRCDNVMALATTVEEVTGMGGKHARARMDGIDATLILDVTYGRDFREDLPIEVGEGPVVSYLDSGVPLRRAVEEVEAAADVAGVRLQREVCDAGGSDMQAFLDASRPIWTVFLGAPSRYNHQPVEVADLGDIAGLVAVAAAWADLPAPRPISIEPAG